MNRVTAREAHRATLTTKRLFEVHAYHNGTLVGTFKFESIQANPRPHGRINNLVSRWDEAEVYSDGKLVATLTP